MNGNPVVTVRQKDVEKVFCPSPDAGNVLKAKLTDHHPQFRNVAHRTGSTARSATSSLRSS